MATDRDWVENSNNIGLPCMSAIVHGNDFVL
jgi:hypothetical protein